MGIRHTLSALPVLICLGMPAAPGLVTPAAARDTSFAPTDAQI